MQWFRFYSEALDDPKVQRLPGDLFKAWVNLLCLANEQEERGTLPLLDDIAFRLRLDHQKAEDALTGLRRAGLLEHNADTDEYRIHAWDKRQYASDISTDRVRKFREKQRETAGKQERNKRETFQKRSSNAIDTDTDTDQTQNRVEQSTPPTPRPPTPLRPAAAPPDRPATDPPGFVAFWKVWPKKEGKAEALAKWRKLHPDADTTQAILDAIPRQLAAKDWPRENWRYCPLPATWLHQRRWEDEVPDPPPKGERELIGKDKERAEVLRRVAARRGYEFAGPDATAHPNGREVSHDPLRIGAGRVPR
jgi:hypothetical protein